MAENRVATPSAPPADHIRAQLDRIVRSSTFGSAPALSRFLRHLVERTLDGSSDALKEYSLGVDVFDRGESFDPKTDTIVRVQARRLRQKLDEYYRTAGRVDPIVIEIPRGRYTAVFTPCPLDAHQPAPDPHEPARSVPSGAGDDAPRLAAPRFGLPASMTPLVGRGREVEELTALLRRDDVRLLTLAGPGGSGKTRLALKVASDVAADFPGGVFLIPLASSRDSSAVASALAQALGLRHTGGAEAMRDWARATITAPTLMVLDTFEHLLDAAPLLIGLMAAAPALKTLVTSRSVLRVYGEHEYTVPPLHVPPPDAPIEAIAQSPAVLLFLQRATAAHPGFAADADATRTIAGICRRLDGLPLAIELAAARIKLFPVETILVKLERALEFLTDGPQDVPARQQTLRNTIDWSYELLSVEEQRLFRRLAVFAGGWTLEGVEAVCNGWRDLGIAAATGMASLLDKSLVHVVGTHAGETRFDMLDTVRDYARERLAGGEEDRMTRRAHSAYCVVLAEEGAQPLTEGERQAWLARCDLELGNFRTTAGWLIAQRDGAFALRLLVALFAFWERRELIEEASRLLDSALEVASDAAPDATTARAWSYLALACTAQGDFARARLLHQVSLEAFQTLGDRRGEASQFTSMGMHCRLVGDHANARGHFNDALAICRELGATHEVAGALSNLAQVATSERKFAEARELLGQARTIFETLGDLDDVAWSTNHLGDLARDEGDLAEARALYGQSLDSFERTGNNWGIGRTALDLAQVVADMDGNDAARRLFEKALEAYMAVDHRRGIARVLEGFAWIAHRDQAFDRALMLAGAASAVRQDFGAAASPTEQAALSQSLEGAWQPREDSARNVWLAGRRMSLHDAIAYALA